MVNSSSDMALILLSNNNCCIQACKEWKQLRQKRLDHLIHRAGGLTANEQELVKQFTPEIVALSERGVDSVLFLHMIRDFDPNDPSSHDIDALERKTRLKSRLNVSSNAV